MKVAVLGLWHLGSVTAACLAAAGHDVAAWDPDPAVLGALRDGKAPMSEPGLDDLVAAQLAAGRLRFVDDLAAAVSDAESSGSRSTRRSTTTIARTWTPCWRRSGARCRSCATARWC